MKTQQQMDSEFTEWLRLVEAALRITRRIVESGGMANKTRVEDELMLMFGIDRVEAHDITNYIESRNINYRSVEL